VSYTLRKEILVQVDTVTVREKFVGMTSRTRRVDETCKCEKVTSSTIYKTKDNLVSTDQVISQPS